MNDNCNIICFLIDSPAELRSLKSAAARFLPHQEVSFCTSISRIPADAHMVILWNIPYICRDLPVNTLPVVFHSSDLPLGRGWAPIYYSMKSGGTHVVTALIASDKVDQGNILGKASFRIPDGCTAQFLREFDLEVCFRLLKELISRIESGRLSSFSQEGLTGSYYSRRKPEDNEVDIGDNFSQVIPHLLSCEKNHPAFFTWKGEKFNIIIEPDIAPTLDIESVRYSFPGEFGFT